MPPPSNGGGPLASSGILRRVPDSADDIRLHASEQGRRTHMMRREFERTAIAFVKTTEKTGDCDEDEGSTDQK
jgi:hypothetical protein